MALDTGVRGRDRSLRDARMSSPASDHPCGCASLSGREKCVFSETLRYEQSVDVGMVYLLLHPTSCWFSNFLFIMIPESPRQFLSLKAFISSATLKSSKKEKTPQSPCMIMFPHHVHMALSEREVPLNPLVAIIMFPFKWQGHTQTWIYFVI